MTINPTAGVATSIAYVVDGDSHRVGKSVAGQTTKYIYDGDTVVAEIDPLGNITYELPDIGYVTSGVQNYYQENGLGSTLSVRSNAGTLQSQSEYDAYGIYYQLVAGPQSDFRFAGGHNYVTDSETGLLELGHRYYIPVLGRFLTEDPTGQSDDLNLYQYCFDNPLSDLDPSGEIAVGAALVIGRNWALATDLLGGGPADPAGDIAAFVVGTIVTGVAICIVESPDSGAATSEAPHNRASEYPHGNSAAVRQKVIDANTVNGEVIDPESKLPIAAGDLTIEHDSSVVEHWNTGGNNMTRKQRSDWYNDPTNLSVRPRSGPNGNSAQGGRMSDTYTQETGPNYSNIKRGSN